VSIYRNAWCDLKVGKKHLADTMIANALRDHPDDAAGWFSSTRAVIAADAGDATQAIQAIDAATARSKERGTAHHQIAFNIACAYAMLNRPKEAVEWLRVSASQGLRNYPLFSSEPFLAGLRNDPGYIAFIAEMKTKHAVLQAMIDAPVPDGR